MGFVLRMQYCLFVYVINESVRAIFYFLFHIKAKSAECHSQFIPTVLLACKSTNLVTITARIAFENNDSGFANVYIWFIIAKIFVS